MFAHWVSKIKVKVFYLLSHRKGYILLMKIIPVKPAKQKNVPSAKYSSSTNIEINSY